MEESKKSRKESEKRATVITLLTLGRKRDAAKILWPWFIQNEWTDKIWNAIESHQFLCVMGHGSASKTFTASAWMLLDWWTHPEKTALIFTSVTIDTMKGRIWSDIKTLWSKSEVTMPGILVDSRRMIQYSPMDQKNAINGVAADSDNAQTKIQGLHTDRIRVIIDEADNHQSRSVWGALSNLGTSGELKVVALANPVDRSGDFGQHVEPKNGWTSINPEVDFEWPTRLGAHALRLDGLRSPNIVAGEDIYPFLLTNKNLKTIRDGKGENSPEWWAYVRAWYPPEGTLRTIFNPEIIQKFRQKIVWYAGTTPIAACDPAFEGGDNCILTLGRMGRLVDNPEKTAVEFQEFIRIKRVNTGNPVTIDFGDQIVARLKAHGVQPENFAIDCTGNALGLSDYIRHAWGEILPVNFGGSPTEMKITGEDSQRAVDRFDRFVSELWYVAREWCKLGHIHVSTEPRELRLQLESRIYELMTSNKIKIEPKQRMKERGLESPDYGDAFCLMIHLARVRSHGFTPAIFEKKHVDPIKRFKKNQSVFGMDYGIKDD